MTRTVLEYMYEDQEEAQSEWPESAQAIYLSGGVWSTAPNLFDVPSHESTHHEERYQLTCLLGQGGMGQVWLGWDQQLQRHVAIKRPHEDESGDQTAQLTYEAMITARLEHPGIVSIYDMYTEDDLPYFVMRLVRGQPLAHHIRDHHTNLNKQRLPSSLVRHLLHTCEAIGHAHRRGICHRDLSPMNILISEEGATHIIDWGLACRIDECKAHAHHVGTPGYIAPEQLPSPRADVWSLGAVLYHILHGCAPEQPFSSVPTSSSPELDAIVTCALAHDPAQRYQDATSLAHELQRWFEGQRVNAYHVTPWRSFVRVARVYRGRIGLAILVVCTLFGSIAAGVMSTREEAQRARDAEQLAYARQEHATQESIKARLAAARLIYKDAQKLADEMDLVNARRRALESIATHDNPDARGLLASLATRATPTAQYLMTLPECPGEAWTLTSNRHTTICYGILSDLEGSILAGWHVENFSITAPQNTQDGHWLWRHELSSNQWRACSPKYVRSGQGVLRVHAHFHRECVNQYMEFDMNSGELMYTDTEIGMFPLSSNTLRMHGSHRYLIDRPETNGVCKGKILNAEVQRDGDVWLICDDYQVWRVSESKGIRRVSVSVEDRSHAIAVHPITQQPWITSSTGRLFTLGNSHFSWEFGESIKEMHFLPDTSLLVMLGLRGKLRVFDTEARRWHYTMPERYSDIAVDKDKTVRAIRHDKVVNAWRFETSSRISRYQGSSGFAMAAWSRDQDLVLGVDGQGRVHLFEPDSGKIWGPYPWIERVGKWVTASPVSNNFYLVGIQTDGIYTVQRDGDQVVLKKDPRFVVDFSVFRRMMISPDELALFAHYGSNGVVLEQPGTNSFSFTDLSFGASPVYDADTSSKHTFVTLITAKNVTRWNWKSVQPQLVHEHDNDVRAASVSESGAILIAKKNELLVFDDRLVHTGTWLIDEGSILDVEWLPHQHVAVLAHLDGRITLRDTRTGELLMRGAEHSERVTKIDVKKNGSHLLSVGWDGMIVIWDLEKAMRPRSELVGLDPQAHSLASSP